MKTNSMWVAEWSQKQQSFHIQTLEESINNALDNYSHPWGSDWTIVGCFDCYSRANELCEQLRSTTANQIGERWELSFGNISCDRERRVFKTLEDCITTIRDLAVHRDLEISVHRQGR